MRKICCYSPLGELQPVRTGKLFRSYIVASKLSQREICRRMGIHPDRLCHLLNGSPRYRWSEEIARAIVAAIKKK